QESKGVLEDAGVPTDKIPPWGDKLPTVYWRTALDSVENGVIPPDELRGQPLPDGILAVLLAAQKAYPSSPHLPGLIGQWIEHLERTVRVTCAATHSGHASPFARPRLPRPAVCFGRDVQLKELIDTLVSPQPEARAPATPVGGIGGI